LFNKILSIISSIISSAQAEPTSISPAENSKNLEITFSSTHHFFISSLNGDASIYFFKNVASG
jgi:hypothetical protein